MRAHTQVSPAYAEMWAEVLASYFCSGVVQRQMAAQARSTSTWRPTRRAGSRPSRCRSTRWAGSVARPLRVVP